jgi:hypothetical protein
MRSNGGRKLGSEDALLFGSAQGRLFREERGGRAPQCVGDPREIKAWATRLRLCKT